MFERALRILEICPDNCDRSCYRCLRSYKNKFEHDLLDRYLGSSLLRFVLSGTTPTLDPQRLDRSTDLLLEDLERSGVEGLILKRDEMVAVAGLPDIRVPILATNRLGGRFAIGLHSPLTPDEPPNEGLRDLMEFSSTIPVILVDELVVRRNLPAMTADLIARLEIVRDASRHGALESSSPKRLAGTTD